MENKHNNQSEIDEVKEDILPDLNSNGSPLPSLNENEGDKSLPELPSIDKSTDDSKEEEQEEKSQEESEKQTRHKEEDEVDKLLKLASERVEETTENKKEVKLNKRPILWATIGTGSILALVIAAGLLMSNKDQEFVDKTKDPEWIAQNEEKIDKQARYAGWDFEYPVEIPDWSKAPYEDYLWSDEDFEEIILKEAEKYSDAINSSITMVPKGRASNVDDPEGQLATPYTSNIDEMYLEDGSENPKFSYTIREDYQKAFVIYTQKLINPVFGDWVFGQRVEGKSSTNSYQLEPLLSMFTEEWVEKNTVQYEDYSKLPILADWNGDNFGNLNFADRVDGRYGTFFGTIDDEKEITSELVGFDEGNSPIVKFTIPVNFYAFGKEDRIEKSGTLMIQLESNQLYSNPEYRIAISAASLKMNN